MARGGPRGAENGSISRMMIHGGVMAARGEEVHLCTG